MALTVDILKANQVLAGLTDEQLGAIVATSANDENAVIGARIGALHGQYDTDILALTAVPKKQGEKSYDYVKRVVGDFKTKAAAVEGLNTQIQNLETEKVSLQDKIKAGSTDAVLKQSLFDTEQKLTQLQKLYDTDKINFTNTKAELEDKVKSVHVDYNFDTAMQNLKFKSTIPDSVKTILLKTAKAEILGSAKPEFAFDQQKNKVLIFRDEKGAILNNPENKLNPFTVSELLSSKLKDVLETGRAAAGTGTGTGTGTDDASVLDLASYKTQIAADEHIVKHLLRLGLVRGSREFAEQQAKIRTDNKVDKLPLR